MAKIEMALASSLGREFYQKRNIQLDEQGRPFFETPGPIEGSTISQLLSGTVVIYEKSDAERARVGETTFVFPGDDKLISWMEHNGYAFDSLQRKEPAGRVPKEIQLASQAYDMLKARTVRYR